MGQLTLPELERHLWDTADLLRGSIDSGDILGLLFHKRHCDVWDEEFDTLMAEFKGDKAVPLARGR